MTRADKRERRIAEHALWLAQHRPAAFQEECSPVSYNDYMSADYRDAAVALWGEAGAYTHDAYRRWLQLYPGLPEHLPITIGLVAYGACMGATRTGWEYGPRITIFSPMFAKGRRWVEDIVVHEMAHAWLKLTDQDVEHESEAWYATVRRLSPAVLGHELGVRRGADRRSVRVPNPDPDGPRTVVRKVRVDTAIQHGDVATWPHAFRPAGYDWGEPIPCPTY